MHRRHVLKLTGVVMGASLAGCSESEEEPVDTSGDETDTDTPDNEGGETAEQTETATETRTQTQTETGRASIETRSDELVVDEGEFTTDVYVAATVENVGDAASGPIELSVDWYDADGNFLTNDFTFLQSLGAGETWDARVYYLGSNTEKVDDYEIEGDYETQFGEAPPDGVSLASSEMKVGEDQVILEGEVDNDSGGELSYLEVVGKIYDGDGVVMDSVWTNVTGFKDGDTWAFDMTWYGSDRIDDAADHEILLTTSSL